MGSPLQQLVQLGQSPWYDFITRDWCAPANWPA